MKNASLFRFILLFLIISGCAQQVYRPTPLPFETAVRVMTEHLFSQVSEDSVFVLDPVIDADTGEVTGTSRKIAELMEQEVQQKTSKFTLQELNQQNLASASYVLTVRSF